MAGLSAADVLRVWEAGRERGPVDRALVMLAAADARATRDALERLPLGARDARLLALRTSTFGSALDARVACPSCTCEVEISVDARALGTPRVAADAPRVLERDGWRVGFRLLDSRDLAAVAALPANEAPAALARRVIEVVERDGQPVAGELPADTLTALGTALADADPDADIELDIECPDCGTRWSVALDVAAFVWAEIDTEARRLLRQVHTLARAYGWREADVLAMGAPRRQAYLELVAG